MWTTNCTFNDSRLACPFSASLSLPVCRWDGLHFCTAKRFGCRLLGHVLFPGPLPSPPGLLCMVTHTPLLSLHCHRARNLAPSSHSLHSLSALPSGPNRHKFILLLLTLKQPHDLSLRTELAALCAFASISALALMPCDTSSYATNSFRFRSGIVSISWSDRFSPLSHPPFLSTLSVGPPLVVGF